MHMTRMPGNSRGDASEERIKHHEQKLNLMQVIGVTTHRVKSPPDPMAEYLAAFYFAEHYCDNEQFWREFLAKAEGAPTAPDVHPTAAAAADFSPFSSREPSSTAPISRK